VVHPRRDDLEGLVVFVAADFTPGHGHLRGLLDQAYGHKNYRDCCGRAAAITAASRRGLYRW
jgi:hypothetical protein